MKIRMGFVSNSSSCSFCIYGVRVQDNDLLDQIDMDNDSDLEAHHYPYDDGYVGISWHRIRDDETGAQFKDRVRKQLAEYGITDQCGTHEEAWRDG